MVLWHGMHVLTDSHHVASFDGDMIIQLSTGLQIRVRNDQYIVPFVDIDRNGSRVFNNSEREFLFNGIPDLQIATLGRYFLTSAYLMIDYDANTFTLWKANPTTSSELVVPGITSDGSATQQQQGQCNNDTGIVQPGMASPSPTPSASSGLSTGAVAGIVIGVVLALTAAGFGTCWHFARRRQRRRRMEVPQAGLDSTGIAYTDPNKATEQHHISTDGRHIYELHSDQRPVEAPGSTLHVYELESRSSFVTPR